MKGSLGKWNPARERLPVKLHRRRIQDPCAVLEHGGVPDRLLLQHRVLVVVHARPDALAAAVVVQQADARGGAQVTRLAGAPPWARLLGGAELA